MKLERIILNGFKSFAEKTEFDLTHGITAVVGPNGCGKSNIVDAVKWVLGEQSVKSLRSGHMADVIFAGSSSRKPSGMAEVTLCFSGASGTLAVEQDQLQIGRRLYRSGESEYLVNNNTCRLKDVRELFMDTGIGVRAYSIIEQGQIDQLLHASTTDCRLIFEEAAGISKYKVHKKEALRRLERTEQNLLRVADILGEVQSQLRSVKLQAGKARSYLQYTQTLKQLRANYCLAEYAKLAAEIQTCSENLSGLQKQLSGVLAEVSANDTLLSELGDEIIRTENEINRSDNSLVSLRSKIEQNLEKIKLLQARLQELAERRESLSGQTQRVKDEKSRCRQQLQKDSSDLEDNKIGIEQKQRLAEEIDRAAHEAQLACAALGTELEDEKSGIIDIVRRTAQLHNEIHSLCTFRDNLAGQKNRLFDRANTAQADLEQLLTEKAQRSTRADEVGRVLADLQNNLDQKRQQTQQLDEQLAATDGRLAQCKETRSALQSECDVLSEMESRREGLNSAAKAVLDMRAAGEGRFPYVDAVLADVLETDVAYAKAVEAAIEDKADALIVTGTAEILGDKQAINSLPGRVGFICADAIEPFTDRGDTLECPGIHGRLIEFVRFENRYASLLWSLLGHTLVIDSIEQALTAAKQLGDKYRFVTLAGEVINGNGVIRMGPLGKAAGLISRKSRLRQLQAELESLCGEIARLGQDREKTLAQKDHLDRLCRELRTTVYEASTEKTEIDSRIAVIEQDIKRLSQQQPLIASEIDLLEEQITQSVRKEYESKQKLEEIEAVNTQRNARIQQLETELAERKKQLQLETNRLTETRIDLGRMSEKRKAIAQTIAALQTQLQNIEQSLASAQEQTRECDEQVTRTNRDILNCETRVSELFCEKEKTADVSRDLHEKLEHMLLHKEAVERLLREKRAEQTRLQEQAHQVQLELGALEVKRTDLLQRVREELEIDLVQAHKDYREETIDWDGLRDQIAEVRGKIERLGNVNLDAIDQQQQLEQRHEFLSSQVEDLNKSKSQLQQLITRINRESKEKFCTTFELIRTNFQKTFRKLFGGGKADILLEDPQDILESGIEIVARPPGKETRSLSLLSGGEKAMTALSLLFAVFETKPSPFCMLDEVDAALDEANNERFNMIVRDFVAGSQFIIITHSKRTMSIADELVGITMQTQGVSKKISVRFDQFEPDQTAAVA